MKYYKQQLTIALNHHGWELGEIDSDTDWWLEEKWRVTSNRQSWGAAVYLYFLVDPQYDGLDKGSAVWCVSAYSNNLFDRPVGEEPIAELPLQKGKLKANLQHFINQLDLYRNLNSAT